MVIEEEDVEELQDDDGEEEERSVKLCRAGGGGGGRGGGWDGGRLLNGSSIAETQHKPQMRLFNLLNYSSMCVNKTLNVDSDSKNNL